MFFFFQLKKDQIGDAWLDGIDWANINSFKRNKENSNAGNEKSQKMDEGVKEEDDNDDASKDSSSDNESEGDEITKENEKDQTEILKKIIAYLRPGETILKAIKRLGQSSSASGAKASTVGLSASQRWLKKKNQDTPQASSSTASLSAEEISALKESLDKLTGFANYFIDRGFYDIYDETYEKIQRKLENLAKSGNGESAASDKKLFDIFADDIDENEVDTPKTSTVDQKQELQGKN